MRRYSVLSFVPVVMFLLLASVDARADACGGFPGCSTPGTAFSFIGNATLNGGPPAPYWALVSEGGQPVGLALTGITNETGPIETFVFGTGGSPYMELLYADGDFIGITVDYFDTCHNAPCILGQSSTINGVGPSMTLSDAEASEGTVSLTGIELLNLSGEMDVTSFRVNIFSDSYGASIEPEPATWYLLFTGIAVLFWLGRRRCFA